MPEFMTRRLDNGFNLTWIKFKDKGLVYLSQWRGNTGAYPYFKYVTTDEEAQEHIKAAFSLYLFLK